MAIALASKPGAKGDETRQRLKQCARSLFSRYGIETVTIRDIAKHAGQKNGGSINYYFRSKEDLILEILDDLASESDASKIEMLDTLEASGKPINVREILKILIGDSPKKSSDSFRLYTMFQFARRDLMHAAIPGRWDKAFARCVVHLHRLLPNLPEPILTQRLYFLIPYLWTFLATREGGRDQAHFWRRFWADPYTMENLLDTAMGLLHQPVSSETLEALAATASADEADNIPAPAAKRRKKARPVSRLSTSGSSRRN